MANNSSANNGINKLSTKKKTINQFGFSVSEPPNLDTTIGETNTKDKRGTQSSYPQQLVTPHIPSTKQEGIRLNLPPQPVQMAPLLQAS